MTGRMAGDCVGYDGPAQADVSNMTGAGWTRPGGRGAGFGRAGGRGMGPCGGGRAMRRGGRGGGRGWAAPGPGYGYGPVQAAPWQPEPSTAEQESEALRQQAEALSAHIKRIQQRLDELDGE